MVKLFSAVILLFLLAPVDLSYAQADTGSVKIYSGYLHQYSMDSRGPFWRSIFNGTYMKQQEVDYGMKCFIEFKSPVSITNLSVTEIPSEMAYRIMFKNKGVTPDTNFTNEKNLFRKFVIKIHTFDDQDYTIDPQAEGKHIGLYGEHHITDSYLIYLILSQEIERLELVSLSSENQDKFVLDKFEIRSNH